MTEPQSLDELHREVGFENSDPTQKRAEDP